jgi:CBS domain-containing protein
MKKLRDVMQPGFLVNVGPDATVLDAVGAMKARNAGIVAVMDDHRLVGVFSERDCVRRVLGAGRDPAITTVREVMTTDVLTANADEPYERAMETMDHANIRHLPVFDNGHLVSMISIRDLLRAALADVHTDLQDLHAYINHVPGELALTR